MNEQASPAVTQYLALRGQRDTARMMALWQSMNATERETVLSAIIESTLDEAQQGSFPHTHRPHVIPPRKRGLRGRKRKQAQKAN